MCKIKQYCLVKLYKRLDMYFRPLVADKTVWTKLKDKPGKDANLRTNF